MRYTVVISAENQLLELCKRANTIDDILKVQAQLKDVRVQIERLQGRINLLQRTSDMAAITVDLAPVSVVRSGGQAWSPLRSIQKAWEQSLIVVVAISDVTLRVLVFLWWLVPPALVAWGAWHAYQRFLRPHPAAGGPGGEA